MAKYVSIGRLGAYWRLYLFALPAAALVAVFAYFPAASAIYHAFFRWNGSYVKEFVGLYNFHQLLGWSPFLWLVMVLWVVLMMALLVGRPLWLAAPAPWGLIGLVAALAVVYYAVWGRRQPAALFVGLVMFGCEEEYDSRSTVN